MGDVSEALFNFFDVKSLKNGKKRYTILNKLQKVGSIYLCELIVNVYRRHTTKPIKALIDKKFLNNNRKLLHGL